MNKIKVLFVCVHNSARSQMAEAFLNHLGGELFVAESAGFEPGVLNPVVVEAMKEIGLDLSTHATKSVFDFFKQGRMFHFVVSVCDGANAERCPIFPGITKRLAWSFADPASIEGSHDEKLAGTRIVRDNIKSEVEDFIKTHQLFTY